MVLAVAAIHSLWTNTSRNKVIGAGNNKSVWTFTQLLRGWIQNLPPVIFAVLSQVWPLHPRLCPHMEVPKTQNNSEVGHLRTWLGWMRTFCSTVKFIYSRHNLLKVQHWRDRINSWIIFYSIFWIFLRTCFNVTVCLVAFTVCLGSSFLLFYILYWWMKSS